MAVSRIGSGLHVLSSNVSVRRLEEDPTPRVLEDGTTARATEGRPARSPIRVMALGAQPMTLNG